MKQSVKQTVFSAVFAALIAALSQISVPLPAGVPITLQTFAVALCGYTMGLPGVIAVAVYLLLGAVGAPVFAGFKGGFQALVGLTGGFLWGFLPMCALCGVRAKKRRLSIVFGLLGLLACHAAGVAQFAWLNGKALWPAFLLVSAPYLPKDIASVALAALLAARLRRTKIFSKNS